MSVAQVSYVSVINNWPDYEVKMITDLMNKFPDPAQAELDQQDRRQKVEAGLIRAQSLPEAVVEQLKQIDPLTRFRWDYDMECWAVDRAVDSYQAWFPVIVWDKHFFGPEGLFDAMREGDMQRFSDPKEHLKAKREAAAKKEKENEQAHTDRMRGTLDGLSKKQIDNFMAVENALITGEKIYVRGSDADTLNRMYKATKDFDARVAQAEMELDHADPSELKRIAESLRSKGMSNSINPGMKPGQYQRKGHEEYEGR